MNKKVVAIIQARMGSTRLPGKVLRMLAGKPMLAQEIERVKESKKIDSLVLATSDQSQDDPVAALGESAGVKVFRGSEQDVLERYYLAAKVAGATVVVRLTGDCPLHDPKVIDEVIEHFLAEGLDYTYIPTNYPEGVDTEVFSFKALEQAWKDARLPSEREHVTPYIRNHPELFKVGKEWTIEEGNYAGMHWSVDTSQDFAFDEEVYKRWYREGQIFHKEEVLKLLQEEPELLEINKGGTGYEGLAQSVTEDELWKQQQ